MCGLCYQWLKSDVSVSHTTGQLRTGELLLLRVRPTSPVEFGLCFLQYNNAGHVVLYAVCSITVLFYLGQILYLISLRLYYHQMVGTLKVHTQIVFYSNHMNHITLLYRTFVHEKIFVN